jgi:hypothetical protein
MADPEYNGGQLRGFEEENAGEDFIDENGKTYEAVGTPKAYQYWSEEKFLASLRDHLYRKSADFTVPDVTGASSEQVDVIFANMDSWVKGATSSSPAIIVGEY